VVAALLTPLTFSAPTSGNASSLVEGVTSHAPQAQTVDAAAVAGGYKNAAYFVNW
jgi:hypothetical protein